MVTVYFTHPRTTTHYNISRWTSMVTWLAYFTLLLSQVTCLSFLVLTEVSFFDTVKFVKETDFAFRTLVFLSQVSSLGVCLSQVSYVTMLLVVTWQRIEEHIVCSSTLLHFCVVMCYYFVNQLFWFPSHSNHKGMFGNFEGYVKCFHLKNCLLYLPFVAAYKRWTIVLNTVHTCSDAKANVPSGWMIERKQKS